ncbi:MAG: multicopper oxidase domain-containing protein [Acidobacteria bacterium]|nr:multicopper oxidase domain-containing protein [Acidobacteriota bacterium]MBI3471884.1 multicopper oxidase domain-containing protein [Candidatus Solibacter usitatus]
MRRRDLLKTAGGLFLVGRLYGRKKITLSMPLPGGTLDPLSIAKFQMPLPAPPAMPSLGEISLGGGKKADYYEIAIRQFSQQILPPPCPATTVWGYGAPAAPGSFSYPAFTIEATHNKPVRVKWINGLVNTAGHYLPHLLPVDQTLHWANPPGSRDSHGSSQLRYTGPVPIVTHLHGGHSGDESDGYPEAWFLPQANNIPAGYFKTGSWYDVFKTKAQALFGQNWDEGTAVFQYPNDQRATTLWYHDHTLGMTRVNVYAGPAGFYLIRGGAGEFQGSLPGPAPKIGDPPNRPYFEIPIVIQDRAFNADGSLFYPDNRAFFEGMSASQLQIPFQPLTGCGGASDVPPVWNPEFFGNAMVVNGRTWPFLDVERRQYRFRFLNGCNTRFLLLEFDRPLKFTQIGTDGGFLPRPVLRNRLLLNPASRADVLVDFQQVPPGARVRLLNAGPDEPFGGGEPGKDFDVSDPNSTGLVMEFRVGGNPPGPSVSLDQVKQGLPAFGPLPRATRTRQLSINENASFSVFVRRDAAGNVVLDCANGEAFGPTAGLLGVMTAQGTTDAKMWGDPITETISQQTVEEWEIFNFTEDAHPIHLHLVQFQVVNRQRLATGPDGAPLQPVRLMHHPIQPEDWESGLLDTVIVYPGMVTRIRAQFDKKGRYVWHCHILEHEDNEMMRPYEVT